MKKIEKCLLILIMLAGAIILFPKDAKAAECSGSTVCGSTCTQGSLTYGTVLGEDGKCWLDRNLGATQVSTSSNDSASYGWLFQWGRGADGHQIRTSQVTSTPSSTDVPGHDFFIHGIGYNADWRDPRNDNLWQGVSGINNPCPAGFRLPTQQEWTTLLISAGITNSVTAFDSVLKLPLGGYRGHVGNYEDEFLFSYYWSSTVDDGSILNEGRTLALLIGLPEARGNYNDTVSAPRAAGFSVRCLADTTNEIPVAIDIRPWVKSNTINIKNMKMVNVALLATNNFSPFNQVDTKTLTFGATGDESSLLSCLRKARDVNRDGFADLICSFSTKSTGLKCGDKEVILKGKIKTTGTPFEAKQTVLVTPCKLPRIETPTASPRAGIYNSTQSVTLSTTTPGADIYYTIDGSNPTTSSAKYTDSILVSKSQTIKAIAVKFGWENSRVLNAKYVIKILRR
jgi:uncharacterized protein (TIGR02145 family)